MKLARIEIDNVLGARHIAVDIATPITIFAGTNGSGKSSIQEAVRMALTGESVRVALKKDYPQLVADGAEGGVAAVTTDDGETYAIVDIAMRMLQPRELAAAFARRDLGWAGVESIIRHAKGGCRNCAERAA